MPKKQQLTSTQIVALLHEHGTQDKEKLESLGVPSIRAKVWEGRAEGTNDYFNRFPANDMEAAEGGPTADEMYTMRWLLTHDKKSKLPRGAMCCRTPGQEPGGPTG